MAHLHPDKLQGLARAFTKQRRRGVRHAVNQGRGIKRGLRTRLGMAVPGSPGQPEESNLVEKLAERAAEVAKARAATKLTGTANAMTRGEGRKVGLHRKAGTTPPPPPGQAKKKKQAKARKDGVA